MSEGRGSSQKINTAGTSNADLPLADPGMYQLDVTLRRGQSLAARDRGGTSDPYVKFKIGGKEVFRSKIIHKNLNPVWEEKACILVDHLRDPLYIKVFDYDFGLQDDFMGSAFLDLTQLKLKRPTDVTLTLKDPHYPDHDLGIILLSVTLTPREGEPRDVFQTQSLRLSDLHRKSHLWRGIVSITLIEGRDLKAMDSNGLSDPYVKFRLGHQKYKSKIMPKTLNPQWREQFDFHLYEERGGVIDITAWDKDAGKRDDFIGRCQVDLSALSREQTHKLELQLEEGEGRLVLLVTLTASTTVSISDLSVNSLEDQKEREKILKRYRPLRIFHNLKDVGFLQVKVIRAEGLMAADVTGKSDPFCVVELNNDRLLTHTVYKNLNPEWNKVFTFNIKDIHSVLEVTVYDEDRDRSADFLGKVAIPLLSIQNGEQKAYVLKNKQLTGPTKGVIYLEIDVIFNAVKASLRTLIPKEQKYIEEENRLSKQLLLRNFVRMKHCVMVLVNAAYYVNSCFDWDSPPRSLAAFVLFLFVVWNFELYMIPLVLLLLLTWNYFLIISGKDNRQRDTVVEDMLEDEEEEDDKDDKFQTQSLRLSDLHRKSHLWRGIVSITLIEGRDLKAMDSNGLSDPYVKFRLGHQKYKSKIMPKTLNPQWREQFDFHLYEERGGVIDITAWDKDAGKRDDFIGRCQVDLSALSREQTHKLELQLEEGEGRLVLLVTLTASTTVSISDLSVNSLEDQKEREKILKRYRPLRIFHNLKDVGFLQVKVIRAEGLMAADVTGKSDPFCVVELNNDRLLTHTVYKNLNPEWNKVFTFNIKDIHSVLEVTVYDEDRDRSADFLGKVAIPLLSIQNGEQKAYVLKNKQLTGPTKGVIYLEIDVIFNAVKASLRTLIPKEQKYIEEENRLSKQLLLRNFVRMKHCVMVLVNAAYYVNSCFDWDSPPRSLAAFVLFLFVVWNFELYMIPLVLLLLLTWNYFLIISGKDNRQRDTVVEDMLEDEEEEDDKDDKDSEKKGFINKIYAIQEVCVSVQNILDEVASFGERIKNTFNWTVPFLSWLAIVALCVFTVILYFIPLRYIVLVWGINKFTKKLRNPYAIDNNELLDFLSRVPSDVQVVQYQELKPDPSHSPCKRKKNNLG